MTETSCIATVFYHPEGDDTGSVGRPIPNLDMKLVDPESGQDISKPNTRGELCVRGPTVVSGYFENDTANRESFDSEGYFRTGDIMFVDGDSKKWYIVDRKKELIKVRGFQVAPPELEAVLLAHPAIIDAAVIGVSSRALFDSSSGSSSSSAGGDSTKHATPTGESEDSEYPRAYIVRRPGDQGAKLTAEDVRRYFEGRLARYKQLDGGVAFVDAIPKNASGKILKRVLRELAAEELKASKRKGGARM
jgi:acyl-CoA synthetase (AMP-forming)/AMP-acid ligase II